MTATTLAVKVDVDTDVGTRDGVPRLLSLFEQLGIRVTFLFALGPDNTGRALRRILRPGFIRKVLRTNVVSTYGFRTLLNGVLWPGPHIGRRNEVVMRAARAAGHEVGIHCYDHIRWQDGLARMSQAQVTEEFSRARSEFERIFQEPARTAGAAGWQANAFSLKAYDDAALVYASDARGTSPFFPHVADKVFHTLQIPTTLPTLDELLGRPEYPETTLIDHYLGLLRPAQINVLTSHAEIEGLRKLDLFRELLQRALDQSVAFTPLIDCARGLLEDSAAVPVCELLQGTVDGRSGTMAVQGPVSTANDLAHLKQVV